MRHTLVSRSADPGWVTEAVVDGYMDAAARDLDGTLTAYRGMARSREAEELRGHLAEIRCPVLLVRGGVPHEGGPTPDEVAVLRRHLPCFDTAEVPGVGHFVVEERPPVLVAVVQRLLDPERTETCR